MAYNKIPEAEFNERLKNVIEKMKSKGQGDQHELRELFRLHNDKFDPHESEGSIFCGGCVTRVYKRMKMYYEEVEAKIAK